MTGSRELQTKTKQLEKVKMQNVDAEASDSRRITIAEKLLRFANRALSIFAACLMAVLFLYGGYSLWDTWRIYHSAFVDDELMKLKPVKGEDTNPSLQDLQNINADVCAWLMIDDTGIDYPVVRGKDDMEYVNKDVYGNFALSGSVFLRSANQPDFSDPYNLIYGHHMSNGAMFGDVVEFTDEAYFAAHQTGTLYLPEETRAITIFACVETDATDSQIYGYIAEPDTAGLMQQLLAYVQEHAVQYRDVGVTADDSIVALSTCAESATNGRVVLFGKMERRCGRNT